MSIKQIYRSINKKIGGGKVLFKAETKKQIIFLNKLPLPRNDIQRSFYQYKCQKHQRKGTFILFNIGSFFMILPMLLYFLFKKTKYIKSSREKIAVFLYPEIGRKIIPHSLGNKYEEIIDVSFNSAFKLNKEDLYIIFDILKTYPYSFYFIAKIIIKIAFYRYLIDTYNPQAIIATSEYSFTSSVLTFFCERNNVKHINIMHGEKLLNIRQSFFRFHTCYVWDSHYINLFLKLRAEKKQFRIEIPPSLIINCDDFSGLKETDFKYYLAIATKQEIIKISNLIIDIEGLGFTIKIRPHPRYSDEKIIKKFIPIKNIENSTEHSINSSICTSRNIIGAYSSVLLQAYLCGKTVFLDDIIFKGDVDKLEELQYILTSKNVGRLSSLFCN